MTEASPFLVDDLKHALVMRQGPVDSIDVGPAAFEAIVNAIDLTFRPLASPGSGSILFLGIPLNPRADMLTDTWEIKP